MSRYDAIELAARAQELAAAAAGEDDPAAAQAATAQAICALALAVVHLADKVEQGLRWTGRRA